MMPWEIPTDSDDYAPDGSGGGQWVDRPGTYLCRVIDVSEREDSLMVNFEVVAGDPDGQQGRTHREYFQPPTPGCKRGVVQRLTLLALATGLATVESNRAAKAAGRPIRYAWDAMLGRRCVLGLTADEYDGKTRLRAGFGLHHPDSQRWPWGENPGESVGPATAADDDLF